MKLVTYEYDGRIGVGIQVEGGVIPTEYAHMLDVIKGGGSALVALQETAARGQAITGYRLLAPVPAPSKLLFSGLNYHSHLQENPSAVLPTSPLFFAKLPSAVIGPEEPIVIPEPKSQVDYEVEFAVVIGKTARKVKRAEALDYVFGYTVANDVSGRDVQFVDNQITTGKGFDTFCPLGPAILLRDDLPDPGNVRLASYVNGEVRQSNSTADMLFDLETLLEFLTAHITLLPGDIVTTGTPAGVGCFRQPPLFLKPGDVVEVEVEGIGRLRNPVVASWE